MINKNLFRISLVVLLAVVALTGCKKDPVGSVSGIVSIYDPVKPLEKIPVDSIYVYLIEVPSKKDTIRVDIRTFAIDSVLTGADGQYSFTAIPSGNYAVYPYPGRHFYQFAPDNTGKTYTFSITGDIQVCEINFTSPIPGSDNENGVDPYEIKVESVNRPEGQYLEVYRLVDYWIIWYIGSFPEYYSNHASGLNTDLATIYASHEPEGIGKVETNDFILYAVDKNSVVAYDEYIAKYEVSQIGGSESVSHWKIDWAAKTCVGYH